MYAFVYSYVTGSGNDVSFLNIYAKDGERSFWVDRSNGSGISIDMSGLNINVRAVFVDFCLIADRFGVRVEKVGKEPDYFAVEPVDGLESGECVKFSDDGYGVSYVMVYRDNVLIGGFREGSHRFDYELKFKLNDGVFVLYPVKGVVCRW